MKKNGVAKAFAPGFGQGGGGKPDANAFATPFFFFSLIIEAIIMKIRKCDFCCKI